MVSRRLFVILFLRLSTALSPIMATRLAPPLERESWQVARRKTTAEMSRPMDSLGFRHASYTQIGPFKTEALHSGDLTNGSRATHSHSSAWPGSSESGPISFAFASARHAESQSSCSSGRAGGAIDRSTPSARHLIVIGPSPG